MKSQIILDVPRSPSVNKLWGYGRSRVYKSKKYKDWIKQCGLHLMLQGAIGHLPLQEDFKIHIIIGKRKKRSDIDNLFKALLDMLQWFQIIANDSQCIAISSEYGEAPEGCKLILTFR